MGQVTSSLTTQAKRHDLKGSFTAITVFLHVLARPVRRPNKGCCAARFFVLPFLPGCSAAKASRPVLSTHFDVP